ncbi:MAG: hypothetical protein JW790_02480 [Dehalococcoidales bacterium]|nr:hypothetical protein [Dehalococcoidales bacterium]
MRKSPRKYLAVFLAVSLLALLPPAPPPAEAADFPLDPSDGVIVDALDYFVTAQESDGNIGGFAVSSWAVMALAAAGEDPHQWGSPSIVDYLEDNPDQIDWEVATDIERAILGIVAAGEDPTDFGGEDYVAALESLYDGEQIGYDDTVNDDFWGILALIAAGESSSADIIQNTADFIIWVQNEDGGWNWEVFEDSEVDDTAAAIMALIAAGNPDQYAIDLALDFLADMQNEDGGFPSLYGAESNSASDAWVIMALVAAGENPTLWEGTGGDDPVENLLSLQDSDGSFLKTDGLSANPEFMTAYAIPALLGETYPVTPFTAPPPEEADLVVSDIDVPSAIYLDHEITVTATIENIGEEDIDESFRVRLYADDDIIDTTTISGLDAGDDIEVELEWMPDDTGDFTLMVIADLDNAIDEASESNNDDTLDVEVEAASEEADLTVRDIEVPSTIYVGEETEVTAIIENIGEEDIDDSFRVRLYADSSNIDNVRLSGLDANDDVEVEFDWTPAAAGDITLTVVADINDEIDEDRENNNDDSLEVEVAIPSLGADLSSIEITVPEVIYADSETTITASVENTGDQDISDTFQIGLSIDGSSVASAPISSLDVGDSASVEFPWTPLAPGDYIIEVVADPDEVITEISENNNSATATVTVSDSEATPPSSISASVAAEDMDFGELAAGETSETYQVTLTNSGAGDILVTAEVAGDAGGFYAATLKLDSAPWEEFSALIAGYSSRTVEVSLEVPAGYSGEILGDGILTFWTALAP